MKRILAVLASAIVLAVTLAAPATAASEARPYVLLADGDHLPSALRKRVGEAGGKVVRTIPEIGVAVVVSSRPGFAGDAAGILGVRSVAPDVRLPWLETQLDGDQAVVGAAVGDPAASGADDPFLGLQWGLEAVDAPQAWAAGARGEGARVAVLDNGIDADHLDVAPNLNKDLSASFVPEEGYDIRPGTYFNHGTHVAGTIAAADNAVGTVGVAPGAEIVAVKVLSEYDGRGSFAGLAQGLVHAANVDADVANMSLAATIPGRRICDWFGCASAKEVSELVNALKRATAYANLQGTTVVAAAGNGSIDRDHDNNLIVLPADLPGVLAVSATGPKGWAVDPATELDTPAYYTNHGQSRIDLAAPGGNLDFGLLGTEEEDFGQKCTVVGETAPCWLFDSIYGPISGGWGWSAGTSMAAPHVSGVAALVVGRNGGSMKPSRVEATLRTSGDDLGKPGNDDFYGGGRVNAAKSVR